MSRDEWAARLSREFAALRGRRVESWVGVEMALRESGADGLPQFEDPTIPFLQLWGLQALLAGGGALRVGNDQDDDRWGLWPRPGADIRFEAEAVWDGIYRRRPLTELPTGRVEQVTTLVDDGLLTEVGLRINGRPLLLIAGEVREMPRGGLRFHRLDDSVLVFTDPAAAARVRWHHGAVTLRLAADSDE
jgi:hypothetical protein